MRIVDRKTFLAMPPETVYAKYEPCVFGELCIKGDTIYDDGRAIDWFYQQIADAIDAKDSGEFVHVLVKAERDNASLKMDFDCQGRDGCYDDGQLFAVFEPQDVEQLINRLSRCVGVVDGSG